MLLKTRTFHFAPSGASADAAEVDADEEGGELSDAELGLSEGTEATATEGDADAEPDVPLADLGAAFKQHGLNLPADPKELDRQWRDMQAKSAQAAEMQQRMNWLLYNQSQQQAAAQAKAQQAAQEKPKPKIFDLPEYDPKWTELVTRDENGNLVPVPGAQPDLPQKIKAYAAAREEAMNRMLADPLGVLMPHLQPHIQEQAAQIAQQVAYQQHQQASLARFEAENTEWVYEKGTRNLTPAAHQWNKFYGEAIQYGLADPLAYANDKFDAILFRIRLQEEANKKEPVTEEDKKAAFLEGAARRPNRGGTLPKPTRKTPAQGKDPWKQLHDELSKLPKEDLEA